MTSNPDLLVDAARDAFRAAPPLRDAAYPRYTRTLRDRLARDWPGIRAANDQDLSAARERGLPDTLVDRLRLGQAQLRHLLALTDSVREALPAVLAGGPARPAGDWGTLRPVARPLGVVLMVYEARPTVTVEGGLLVPAVGNAVILRGGREMAHTDAALATSLRGALAEAGLPEGLVSVVADPDRSVFRALLTRSDAIDVLIPRGSPSLIEHCRRTSTIPVIASGGGVNHLYVHADADLDQAARITLDSKVPEPTACNTLEVVLVQRSVAEQYQRRLLEAADGTGLRVRSDIPAAGVEPLSEQDFGREYLGVGVTVHVVDSPEAALAHIRRYGSGHTEGILTRDPGLAERFVDGADAATVVVNGSLRLHDGPTLGLGPELSISTGRIHVRGPLTLSDLVGHSWRVDALGTLRADLTPAHDLPSADLENSDAY